MLKILLVEDDKYFRDAVADILTGQGWKVLQAPDGRAARDIIKASEPFDLILSDIQMPHLTGLELLAWVKENKPMPFILMTGFALIMETKKAHELGADDFLSKPFAMADMLETVKRHCGDKLPKPSEVLTVAPEYCKASLEEFVTAGNLNFDVYVQLGSRFVRIGHKGDAIPVERIHMYKSKGLKHLFVRRDDFKKLVTLNLNLAKMVASTDKISKEKKANFMRYTGEVLLEKAFISGVNKESYDEAKDFLTTSLDILTEEPQALGLLESLNGHSDYLYAHSLCVSMFSVLIAKNLDWNSSQNLFKLSLAGIFHDIGKKEVDRAILNKPRAQLNANERQLIESHCVRGREILISLTSIPSEVVAVAYEHHEDALGTGFPRALSMREVHPFTPIVRVANLFTEFSLKSPAQPGMTPQGAIFHVEKHYGETVSPVAFKALKAVFETS